MNVWQKVGVLSSLFRALGAAIVITGLITASTAYAALETIKLLCSLEVITQPPYGGPTTSRETSGVEMLFDTSTGFKGISIDSLTIGVSVANGVAGGITSYTDDSNDSRWAISTNRTSGATTSQQMVTIDRNTGRLTAYDFYTVNGATLRSQANGACDKVDTSKQKF